MMAPRLVELRRVLKPTGSLYLHCDASASAHLRLLVDAVFQPENFRAEVIWKRTNSRSTEGRWPRVHDVVLMYSKTATFTFVPITVRADAAKMPHTLITGADDEKYQTYELTAPGITKEGESGKAWRGYDPAEYGRHWANNLATREAWDSQGLIHWPKELKGKKGWPRRRAEEPFDESERNVVVGDVWTDIDRLNQTAKERLGYPTQKPVTLLERIITASSNEGDVVLDPFCGCGTTIDAAQRLKREWIGIDITHLAVGLIKHRLLGSLGAKAGINYKVVGEPTDLEGAKQLALEDRHQFEHWALGLVGARASAHGKGADKGIDGLLLFQEGGTGTPHLRVPISVKSGQVHSNVVSELRGVVEREKAALGVLIVLEEPTAPMKREAASAGFYESPWGKHPRLQILTIEELLGGKGINMPPIRTGGTTFKQAPRAEVPAEPELTLPGIDAPPLSDGTKRRRK